MAKKRILIGLMLLTLAACGHRANTTDVFDSIVDDYGRAVAVPLHPKRIVSVSPAVTEIVFALGGDNLLVGRTDFCTYPDEAKNITSIGGISNLNIEAILDRKPDLVLCGSMIPQKAVEKLEHMGVPVVCVVEKPRFEGLYENIAAIGRTIGLTQAADSLNNSIKEKAAQLSDEGKTPLYFCRDGEFLGIIAVSDVIKDDSAQAVQELRHMGIRVVMLTGDNERTAKAIGAQAGIDEVIADVRPDGKESVIRRLMEQGKTAMVGDGINDAPALTRANIGIAIGAGTDVAIDAADVVLMHSRLSDVPAAVRLSRAVLRNVRQNLFWALFYNSIGIPLAMGIFVPLGLTLNPMFGAAAMSLSSFCVVSNALRLNLFDMRDAGKDKPIKHRTPEQIPSGVQNQKEETNMTKTLDIQGMMCEHCEARVKKALEALDAVEEAKVSHESGTAVVTLKTPAEDDVLKKAVEDQDYQVLAVH